MQNYLIRLKFSTAIHVGNDSATPDRSTSNNIIHADTFYSAMLIESLNYGKENYLEEINNIFKNGSLISDLMPYTNNTYFVPKPIMFVENKENKTENRFDKKLLKKLTHLNINNLSSYLKMLKGEDSDFNPVNDLQDLSLVGKHETRVMSRIEELENNKQLRMINAKPFYYGTYSFNKNSGLYLLLQTENKNLNKIINLIKSLGYTGIGGKKSSGLGKYIVDAVIDIGKEPGFEGFKRHFKLSNFNSFMSLSVCLPNNDELEKTHKTANYILLKRSGFVFSEKYSNTLQKKKDIYVYSNGSVFKNMFNGDIYDVSLNGNHKVYRYLKPFLIGV